MIIVREYEDERGKSPFASWLDALNSAAAIKVAVALERISAGHTASMKPVGEGVSEYRIDFGPGYRIYFGRDGDQLVILVGGGMKQRQQRDIVAAQLAWKDYKRRKRQEG